MKLRKFIPEGETNFKELALKYSKKYNSLLKKLEKMIKAAGIPRVTYYNPNKVTNFLDTDSGEFTLFKAESNKKDVFITVEMDLEDDTEPFVYIDTAHGHIEAFITDLFKSKKKHLEQILDDINNAEF